MIEQFKSLSPVLQALSATCFTWFMTALGAGLVFVIKTVNRRFLNGMLGFAAGAMMFVVVEELIPESQSGNHPDIATIGTMLGFIMMMRKVSTRIFTLIIGGAGIMRAVAMSMLRAPPVSHLVEACSLV